MKNRNEIIISKEQFKKISDLILNYPTPAAEELEEELGRAIIVEDHQIPHDIVMIHSQVTFVEAESGKKNTVTLVYPNESNIDENKVSILAPIGIALIGLSVGQNIDWILPNGKKSNYQVIEVRHL